MRIRVLAAAALALCAPVALAASNRPAGELDFSFGDHGRVFFSAGGYSEAEDLVVQPDRKVVLAGIVSDGNSSKFDFLAVRLNRNGGRDRSFGNRGIVRTPIELGGMRRVELAAVARTPQGAIVLAGKAHKSVRGDETDFAVVRIQPSGVLDSSFSDDGVQTVDVDFNDFLSGVVVQPDGKIVLVGYWYGAWPAGSGFIVIRLLPNGALDHSFGSGGVVDTKIGDPSDGDAAADVAVLGNGRIVVAGTVDLARQWSYGADAGTDFAVVRYLPDGRKDPTFGEGGIVRTPGPQAEIAADLVVTPEEMIVVVGNQGWPGYCCRVPPSSSFYLARYLPTGALDPTFGTGGTLTTSINTYTHARSVAVQGDGKIIAGGVAGSWDPPESRAALARYNEDGTLDRTFGVGGTRRYPRSDSFASAFGIQPLAARSGADRLIMAGAVSSVAGTRVAVMGIDLGSRPLVRCRVPYVVGLTLARARARIRSAHCRVGRVRRAHSARRREHVISQRPRAGRRLASGSRVALVVSMGR